MRKIITSSVLILLFSLFSGSVFAGKHDDDCGDFKKSKGLYGLCNAYQNALAHDDQDAMDNISRNWDKKVGDDGLPELPNYVDPNLLSAVCPCWTDEQLLEATCFHDLTLPGIGGPDEFAEFDLGYLLFFAWDVDGLGLYAPDSSCLYQNAYDSENSKYLPTTSDENLSCHAGVQTLVNMDLYTYVNSFPNQFGVRLASIASPSSRK